MIRYLQAQPPVLRQPTVLLIATNTQFVRVHDYTQNRDELIDVVKKHMPEYPWRMMKSGPSGPGAVERMAQVLAALQQVAQATDGTSGRKNIIWVGNGFPTSNFVGLEDQQAAIIQAFLPTRLHLTENSCKSWLRACAILSALSWLTTLGLLHDFAR